VLAVVALAQSLAAQAQPKLASLAVAAAAGLLILPAVQELLDKVTLAARAVQRLAVAAAVRAPLGLTGQVLLAVRAVQEQAAASTT